MDLSQTVFAYSPSIRASLKRGLARAAFTQAAAADPDLASVVAATRAMHPNRKALERSQARLSRLSGVVKAAIAADGGGVVVVLRNRREVVTQAQSVEVFSEPSLFYTRLVIRPGKQATSYALVQVSFCLHALERCVERSDVALDRPLLPVIDAEAVRLLRRLWQNKGIVDDGDTFFGALKQGVWAGSIDRCALEDGCGLACLTPDGAVPLYSIRTFLSPEEMRPTVWLKWKDDPACCILN
ncbi:hypothetical protein [Paragemmobacter straminiformis]|uniref:Uncharacterized protein n=1 Tax=Paragemmobacter straminiformis TaxID=2045119 RepID=A0A842I3Q6_9RHOB|nr:hypothetical protein [Gemmobacter straminiformis]MBC2834067.1 hypothetical protein [Gemmobacter straminiformis]